MKKMYNVGKPATLLYLPQDFGIYVVQLHTHTCIIFCTFFSINLAHCITVASSILFSMQHQQPPYSYSIDCIQKPHRVPFHVLFFWGKYPVPECFFFGYEVSNGF